MLPLTWRGTDPRSWRHGGLLRLPDAGPDPVDAAAWRDLHARATSPERRLAVAILDDAIAIVLKRRHRTDRERVLLRETQAWLRSDRGDHPFSFLTVCAWLDLDPAVVRARLATVLA